MSRFVVGERVQVAPDFSNDGFDPFEGEIVEIDDQEEPPLFYIRDEEGNTEPWMLGNVRRIRKPTAFVQEMGQRDSDLGTVLYIRIRREDDRPMPWTEVWDTFADAYPGQWAVQVFPPAESLVDEANLYHLYVLESAPRGLDIRQKD